MPRRRYDDMTPGQKAWHTRKWRAAQQKSHQTARNAKTFTRYALTRAGWRVVSFDTLQGYEYKGVADLVAIKRNNRAPDEITVMLLQVKGGKARLAPGEIDRLRAATKRVRLTWNIAEKAGKTVQFRKPVESQEVRNGTASARGDATRGAARRLGPSRPAAGRVDS